MKDRAEASFKRKEIQAREGIKAMAEYEADKVAVRAKTERLRELRLAKEAADAKAEAEKPAKVAKPVKAGKAGKTTGGKKKK